MEMEGHEARHAHGEESAHRDRLAPSARSESLSAIRNAIHCKRIDGSPEQRSHIEVILEENIDNLIDHRDFVQARSIPGAECLPFYQEDYEGTFNASVSKHLPKIVPHLTVPTSEEIQALEDWRHAEPGRADLIYGAMNAAETAVIQSIVAAMQPRTIFEFETHQGILVERMMEVAPKDAVCFTLDLPPSRLDDASIPFDATNRSYVKHDDEGMGQFISEAHHDRVIRMHGDSYKFDPDPFAGRMDIVIVDGSHQYEVARKDIEHAWEMLQPGGVMLIDNYSLLRTEGTVRATLEHRALTGAAGYLLSFHGDLEIPLVMFVKGDEPTDEPCEFFIEISD